VKALQKQVGGIDVKVVDIYKDFATADAYDIQSTPTIVVLDRAGQVVQMFVGYPVESRLKSAMEAAKK